MRSGPTVGFISTTSGSPKDSFGCAGFDYYCGVLHGSRVHGKYSVMIDILQLKKADCL